jgi:hypothetical protein
MFLLYSLKMLWSCGLLLGWIKEKIS